MSQKGAALFGLALAAWLFQPALSGRGGGTARALDPPAPDASEAMPAPKPIPSVGLSNSSLPQLGPPSPVPLAPTSADILSGPGFPPLDEGMLVPNGQTDGWFFTLEGALLKPHINSHLNAGSSLGVSGPSGGTAATTAGGAGSATGGQINLFGAPVVLPVADLNWTGSPYLELGYRLPGGAGDFRLGYQILASQGSQQLDNFDAAGAGLLRSRVNLNRLDFFYSTNEFLLDPPPGLLREIRAGLGITAVNVFFDSQAQGQQILNERASSNFAGIGPKFLIEWIKPLPKLPVAFYSHLDASGLWGKTRQHFGATQLVSGDVMSASSSTGPQSDGVALFTVEGGLSHVPNWSAGQLRLTLGYRWQRYWWAGATDISNADLTLQGVFLRGEYRY